jgi:hypothetical protein
VGRSGVGETAGELEKGMVARRSGVSIIASETRGTIRADRKNENVCDAG